jgi:hypothetical protein
MRRADWLCQWPLAGSLGKLLEGIDKQHAPIEEAIPSARAGYHHSVNLVARRSISELLQSRRQIFGTGTLLTLRYIYRALHLMLLVFYIVYE